MPHRTWSRRFRLRWFDPDGEPPPAIGTYLVMTGPRARAAYLIHGSKDRGMRGGLGEPIFRLLMLSVERVPRDEALAGTHIEVFRDKPQRRKVRRLVDYQVPA